MLRNERLRITSLTTANGCPNEMAKSYVLVREIPCEWTFASKIGEIQTGALQSGAQQTGAWIWGLSPCLWALVLVSQCQTSLAIANATAWCTQLLLGQKGLHERSAARGSPRDGPTVLESTVSNTELSEFFCPHRVLGRGQWVSLWQSELTEFFAELTE